MLLESIGFIRIVKDVIVFYLTIYSIYFNMASERSSLNFFYFFILIKS